MERTSRALRRIGLLALIALTVISFAPVVSVAISIAVAQALGCQVDEGSVHPCVRLGVDLGTVLTDMFVLGWLALATMPGMLLAAAIWVILLVRALVRRVRRGPAV